MISAGIRRNAAPIARALEVGVDAEAREAGDRVREVELPARLEQLLLLGREDAVDQVVRVSSGVSFSWSESRSRRPLTRITGGEPAVRWRSEAFALDHHGEQVVD